MTRLRYALSIPGQRPKPVPDWTTALRERDANEGSTIIDRWAFPVGKGKRRG